ncbi:MAG: hypothetical protein SNH63_07545 [Rikenellaceae bacterium]
MAQNIQRMVVEVNKLITNELITAGGIYLPEIGSLSVEHDDSAEARRRVIFSAAKLHTSLITVIAMQTKCSVDQASTLYTKWSEAVHKNLQVEIEGIGVVRGGRFEASSIIEQKLNPVVIKSVAAPKAAKATKSATPEKVTENEEKKRSNWGVWIIAVAAVVLVAVAIPKLFDSQETEEVAQATTETIPETISETTECQEEVAKTEEVKIEDEVATEEIATETPPKTLLSTRKAKTTSNAEASELLNKTLAESSSRPATKYKVVYGVYRSKANAGRALIDAQELNEDTRTVYGATLREGHYMVTLFESDHFYTSVSYMKRNNPAMGNVLWVYDPQKM